MIKRHQEIIKVYSSGSTLQQTGDKFGVSKQRILAILKREGVPRRSRRGPDPGQRHHRIQTSIPVILEVFDRGYPVEVIAKALHCSPITVRSVLIQHDRIEKKKRERRKP